MSYRIVYGPDVPAVRENRINPLRLQLWTAVFAVAFVLLVRQVWPEGRTVLQRILLPGEPGITEAALIGMVEGLQAGEGVGEALTAFCRQIIHGQAA